jgi:hypothetical protein
MLSRRALLLTALLMGGIQTFVVSFALTAAHHGFGPGFLSLWLQDWLRAYPVAVAVIYLALPAVRAVVARVVASAPRS